MLTPTRKCLNFGCGPRYHETAEWENIDLIGRPPFVQQVDLRKPLPYSPNEFDFVYTSHVLDHFPLAQVNRILSGVHTVLKPKGIVRISVPDLATNAEKYLRSLRENGDAPLRHMWFTIELIDQMTRTAPGGEKASFLRRARGRPDIQEWLRPILGYEMLAHLDAPEARQTPMNRLKHFIKKVLPARPFEETGERHYWTFDEVFLKYLLHEAGFQIVERKTFNQSGDSQYLSANLDVQCGREYKPGSLYVEAVK